MELGEYVFATLVVLWFGEMGLVGILYARTPTPNAHPQDPG